MEEKIWKDYRASIIQGENYVDMHQRDMQVVSRRISTLLETEKGPLCIDIGCGPGELLDQLKKKLDLEAKFIGVDISASQISEA